MNNILSTFSTLLIIFAVLSGVMYLRQPGMIFFPVNEFAETPEEWGLEFEDITLVTKDDISIHGWFIPRDGAKRTLLFFHGNAGNISHRGESVKIFNRLGLNVFIIDYRGYGKSQGKPQEQGMYLDAESAWRYLTKSRNILPENIIIFGRSLGGAVATKLASERRAGGLILESTFSSANDMARSIFPLLSYLMYIRFDFNSELYIKKVKSPLLYIHSPDDEIVPFRLGEKVFLAANEPKSMYQLSGDHNAGFYISQPGYELALGRFLNQK